MAKKIEITLVKSIIGELPGTRATVRCLGLRKVSSKTVKEATPAILGMCKAVGHLLSVKEIE
jgi:large subunit ribosomal protein L30